MATRGEELAERFEQANANFIRALERLTPEQWTRSCPEVGWSLGVTAHHVAEDHGVLAGIVSALAAGQAVPPINSQMLDGINAEHAQRAANVTQAETIELARSAGANAAEMLRGVTDDQLERTAQLPGPNGTQELSAGAIAENILIGHIGMHLPMIENAAS